MASRPRNGSLSSDLMGGMYDDRPSYADGVADECAQIRLLRENPGGANEPQYHAGVGVLHFCTDGRDRAFKWIDEAWHPELEKKFERAEKLTGPTTCDHFRSINPDGCRRCPHAGHIATPLELGRKCLLRHSNEGPVQPAALSGAVFEGEGTITPPKDFAYGEDESLNLVIANKQGKPTLDLISQYPVYLKTVQTGENDEHSYGYVFRTYLPNRGWDDIVLPARAASGRDASQELAGKGLVIHNGDAWRKFVRSSVDKWHAEHMTERRYDKFGWKDDDTSFLVGKRLYTSTGVTPIIGSELLNSRSKFFDLPHRGSFERWQRAANKMFALGLEHQSIAILAGFAAPLMRFHTTTEGGAILSFISEGGTGKTTSLEAAASIWGQLDGIKVDDSDTRIAKGLKLGVLSNLPCSFDDLYERDPEAVRQFIMMFTNGTDKDRATTEGTLRENNSSWQTILLLASNKSMIDTLSNHDASHACATRILELSTTLPVEISKDDFDALRREIAINHGFAGDRYLRTLMQPNVISWIKDNISIWTKQIRKAAELEEHHRFWVRLAVSIIAAGTIVQNMGLLDFSVIRIRDWLIETMKNQRDQIKGTSKNNQDAPGVLSRFIHDMRNDILTVDKAYRPGSTVIVERPPTNKLLCRYETDTRRMVVTEIELRKWLNAKAINSQTFVKTLQEKGVIVGEVRKHTLGAGTNFASGQTPCFVINLSHALMTDTGPLLKVVQ